jgi:hypothetical protein
MLSPEPLSKSGGNRASGGGNIRVIVALAGCAIASLIGRGGLSWLVWLSRSWLLVLLGVLALVSGVLPLLGLAALVLALTLKVHRFATRSPAQ